MDHSGKEDQGIHILFLRYDRELSVTKEEMQRPDTPISESVTHLLCRYTQLRVGDPIVWDDSSVTPDI